MHQISYRAVFLPDYYTQTFDGTGETREAARLDCENQLQVTLDQLRQHSKESVILVSFVCLDPVEIPSPKLGKRADKPWKPKSNGAIMRNLKSMFSLCR